MKTSDFIGLLSVDFCSGLAIRINFRPCNYFRNSHRRQRIFSGNWRETRYFPSHSIAALPFQICGDGNVAAGATGTVLSLARPCASLKFWYWILMAVPLLLACAVAVELIVMPRDVWMKLLVGKNSRVCLTLISLLAIGPLACLLIALRQGASEKPGFTGGLAGMAASGIAATFYAANCTDDSPLFVSDLVSARHPCDIHSGICFGREAAQMVTRF